MTPPPSTVQRCVDQATTPQPSTSTTLKRKCADPCKTPNVTDWVIVQLDKRKEANRTLATAPAVVSRVDVEKGTINLLYPNHLSAFFFQQSDKNPILFAIQTHPLSKVRRWEGCTEDLQKLLSHALLNFAEQRGSALKNADRLRVSGSSAPTMLDGSGKVVWSAKTEILSIQRGLAMFATNSAKPIDTCNKVCNNDPAKSDHDTKQWTKEILPAPEVKESCAKEPDRGEGATCDGRPEVAVEVKPDAVPETGAVVKAAQAGNLQEFTAKLAHLLNAQSSGSMPKASIKDALASRFSAWETFLVQLDAMNKILVAEDAVFRL